jgi:hypothetical protein
LCAPFCAPITLTYDGTTLTETIHDPDPGKTNGGNFTTTYTLDIAGRLSADTAFVGFTGGTGGLFSLQDILNWPYAEQEGNLPPRAPTNLQVTSVVRHDNSRDDVTLTWQCNNAYTAQGFSVERSTDGVNFTQIASLSPMVTTYTDQRAGPGALFYRVRSFNAQGFSRSSNVATAEINVPAAPVNLQILNLFAQHAEIGWDPNSSDQTGFQVQRSSDGVNFTTIATVDAYTTSYTDVRFTTTVYYRVEAIGSNGAVSLPSNVLQINYVGQFVSQARISPPRSPSRSRRAATPRRTAWPSSSRGTARRRWGRPAAVWATAPTPSASVGGWPGAWPSSSTCTATRARASTRPASSPTAGRRRSASPGSARASPTRPST